MTTTDHHEPRVSESFSQQHASARKTVAVITRWVERECQVERPEALRMVARALRRYGPSMFTAWQELRLHPELVEANGAYEVELVIGRSTLV